MSQNTNKPANTDAESPKMGTPEWERRDEENKRRFTDQSGLAPQDIPGAEHGQNAFPPPGEMTRNLPHQHGGELGGEGGMRGDRQISDADDHGGRKHN